MFDQIENFHELISSYKILNSLIYENLKEPNFELIEKECALLKQDAAITEEQKEDYQDVIIQKSFK